jgi:hypothetical protein
MEAALNIGDIEAFLQLSEDGATQPRPPKGERVIGRDALRAAVAPIFALGPTARMESGWPSPTGAGSSTGSIRRALLRCPRAGSGRLG